MNDRPLVSVILPTRNRAGLLGRAMASVLEQSYRNVELIVVDDASTDGTPGLVRSFPDGRVRYEYLPSNAGSSAARNHGIGVAEGTFVAFQDSDDVWHKEKLARQIDAFASAPAETTACVCSYRLFKDGRVREHVHRAGAVAGDGVLKRMLSGESYSTPSLLVRRDAFDQAGRFDESLPRRQDFELCLRLAQHGGFVFVPDVLLDSHYSGDSLSLDPLKFVDATEKIRARHPELFSTYRRGESVQLYKAGKHLAVAGHYKMASAFAWRALAANPFNAKAHVLLAAALTRAFPVLKAMRR